MADYRIFRSDDALLIRGGEFDLELSHEDALALACAITDTLRPARTRTGKLCRAWTAEDIARLRELYLAAELSVPQIAAQLGRGTQTTNKQISRLGIANRNPGAAAAILARHAARKAA